MKLFATDVFTPNEFPEHTYIERPKEELERKLKNALATPNVVVSIAGPSKSGKTVLTKKLVGDQPYPRLRGRNHERFSALVACS